MGLSYQYYLISSEGFEEALNIRMTLSIDSFFIYQTFVILFKYMWCNELIYLYTVFN